jgi:hypothetical protein
LLKVTEPALFCEADAHARLVRSGADADGV